MQVATVEVEGVMASLVLVMLDVRMGGCCSDGGGGRGGVVHAMAVVEGVPALNPMMATRLRPNTPHNSLAVNSPAGTDWV